MLKPCCFCDDLSRKGANRVIWEDPSFVLTPTVGPLARGHSLLIPRRHIPSFRQLPRETWAAAEAVIERCSVALARPGERVVGFEHGMESHTSTGGCGISHAHIHLVPVPANAALGELPRERGDEPWRMHRDRWLPALPSKGYLLLIDRGIGFSRSADEPPSQYLRRWLASRLECAEWDWRKAPQDAVYEAAMELRLTTRDTLGFLPT